MLFYKSLIWNLKNLDQRNHWYLLNFCVTFPILNKRPWQKIISDESLFLISIVDPWYGDIIIYLQTQTFRLELSWSNHHRIRYQSQQYNIVGHTLYRRGADFFFWSCLTHEEAKKALNDYHFGACGGHMYGFSTVQNILRVAYLRSSLFKYCILAVRKCHNCQFFDRNMRAPPTPLRQS